MCVCCCEDKSAVSVKLVPHDGTLEQPEPGDNRINFRIVDWKTMRHSHGSYGQYIGNSSLLNEVCLTPRGELH